MNEIPQLTVIIPTFQRRNSIWRALDALRRQTLEPLQFEVIVIVDGSNDGTMEMLEKFETPYTLRFEWQQNSGRATACNAGIRLASSELVVLLDDDMEPVPEFLAEHQSAHAVYNNLGVIGAAPIQLDALRSPVMEYIANKFNAHMARLAMPGYRLKLRDVYSGNFSIRRELLWDAGAFDEQFRVYGNEDLELACRLTQMGVRFVFNARARAFQHYNKNFPQLARDHFSKGKTSLQLVMKHPETLPQLKLSGNERESMQWRLLRRELLNASWLWRGTPQVLIRVVQMMEQRRVRQIQTIYRFVLDYFYWLGVETTREQYRAARTVYARPFWRRQRRWL
jgi:glycosyltransferase involved in cell wall biosynthesis